MSKFIQGRRPTAAIDNLRQNQRQLDADGTHVGVSRQALDELLTWADSNDPRTPAEVDYDMDRGM